MLNGLSIRLSVNKFMIFFNDLQFLQSSLYEEQSAEVSLPKIQEAQQTYKLLLLAFPGGPRHHEVEDMIYGVQ